MRHNRDRHSDAHPSHDKARQLRRDDSMPERIVWKHLRDRRLHNLKFRRPHPIGPYTADFFCASAHLVVELDGQAHLDRQRQDRVRDEYMSSIGLNILRFSVWDVSTNLDGVLKTIARVALERMEER